VAIGASNEGRIVGLADGRKASDETPELSPCSRGPQEHGDNWERLMLRQRLGAGRPSPQLRTLEEQHE
jgi:hypothetical protein